MWLVKFYGASLNDVLPIAYNFDSVFCEYKFDHIVVAFRWTDPSRGFFRFGNFLL